MLARRDSEACAATRTGSSVSRSSACNDGTEFASPTRPSEVAAAARTAGCTARNALVRAHTRNSKRSCVIPALLRVMSCVLVDVTARAEPSLRVRAQVTIELHTANTASGLRLVGALRDDLGAPLANRELTAYFEPQT